jgi:sorbitol/mannitol transport system substrate-binding protein
MEDVMKKCLVSMALCLSFASAPAWAKTTVTLAFVNNPDMVLLKELSPVFMAENPDINLQFQVLPENILLNSITQDAAVGGGRYDVVNAGTYEVQGSWAANKWLSPLNPLFAAMPAEAQQDYDLNDIIKTVRDALTVNGQLYALPVYGESSFTMYRKDLFAQAHLTMPERPTWDQIRTFACKLNDPSHGVYGISMKGVSDYSQLAPFITLMHSFGAEWFNMNWQPQITSPAFVRAFNFYIDLLKDCGEPGASSVGFNEGLTLVSQGKVAIWVDATAGANVLQDPTVSKVVDKIGYALAPTEGSVNGSAWLWASGLGIVAGSKHQSEAFRFITWATSKEYIQLVAKRFGAVRTPPGTRYSTYQNPAYLKAAPFAPLTLEAIEEADMIHPAKNPVPYTGTAHVNIPEYASWASDFAQNFSAVVAGTLTADQALKRSQATTEQVMKDAGYIKN